MGSELLEAVLPPVIWESPTGPRARGSPIPSTALSGSTGRIPARAVSGDGKLLSALRLVFLFLPLLLEPDVTSAAVKLGGGGAALAAVPSSAVHMPVCLSVCPHLAASSSPAAGCVRQLPVKSVSLSSEELMAVLGNGKTRSTRLPTPRWRWRQAGRAGRESPGSRTLGEPTQA